ncbi:MAG: S8 family peptidase [Candidatus Korarchaeota archaeon]
MRRNKILFLILITIPLIALSLPGKIYISRDRVPTDPYLAQQWGWFRVEADAAWYYNYTGKGVIIAVLDTGADLNHPDLENVWWRNDGEIENGIDDDGNGYVDDIYGWNFVDDNNNVSDDNGHGTMVIGVIAAQPNTIGIIGVAPDARIMVLKVLNKNGSGSTGILANAINYAKDMGARIISMSLGSDSLPDPILELAIENANLSGILLIAAAGNDNKNTIDYPASNDKVIAVTATTINDTFASYSNYGSKAELSAPGGDEPDYIISTGINGEYINVIGTSIAVPFVSGLAALAMERYPNMSAAQIRQLLANTSDDLGTPGWDKFFGYGRVNACTLLQLPNANPFPIPNPNPSIWEEILEMLTSTEVLVVLGLVTLLGILLAVIRYRAKKRIEMEVIEF